MAKRKLLKSVAFDIAHCFRSRNNRIGDYWALGPLFHHAVDTSKFDVEIDLLAGAMVPESARFQQVIDFYSDMLRIQLKSRNLPENILVTAVLKVEFETKIARDSALSVKLLEKRFTVTVLLVDDTQKQHRGTIKGWCFPEEGPPVKKRGPYGYEPAGPGAWFGSSTTFDLGQYTRMRRYGNSLAIGLISFLFAVVGVMLTAWLAEVFRWLYFTGWALAHGTGMIVLMAWGLLGFHIASALAIKSGRIPPFGRFGLLPHVAYISPALQSYFFTDYLMWVGLAAGIAAVIMRWRGFKVQPFGLAIVGLIISLHDLYIWHQYLAPYATTS